MKSGIIIETERLFLRHFTMDDVRSAYAMDSDPRVTKYTGDGGAVSRVEVERRIREDVLGDYEKYGYGRWAVELKADNHFIGFAGLKYISDMKMVDLGYRLIPEVWGRGLATEAGKACVDYGFSSLNLKEISAMVLPENISSIRVLEKLGFHFVDWIVEDGMQIKLYKILA